MREHERWRSARRKAVVALATTALVAGAGVASTASAASAAGAAFAPVVKAKSAFAQELEGEYIDPSRVYSTDVRWWLGEASHTDETLLEEIQALYDGGFRGVELAMQGDEGAPDSLYGYGTEMWTHKWNLMMNKLLDLGMGVYLTSGTNWRTSNVPGLDPASQAAMQNLTLGTSTVAPGGRLTTLTAPATKRAGATFYTAYAYRVIEGDKLDPASFVDLSPRVTQGADVWTQNLDWTAPGDGTYRVFGMWSQGTYQTSTPSATPAYATNYFDERGVEALRTFWEEHYLADPALRAKIAAGNVHVFMDSLEIELGGGFVYWSEDMAQQFLERKGYDIRPYLYLLVGANGNRMVGSPYTSVQNGWWDINTSTFKKLGTYSPGDDEKLRQSVINDFQDVQTQLMNERMYAALKEWLNSVGIETRAQISYGKTFEISEPIQYVDYPEAEDLNQNMNIDLYRLHSGGAKLLNKKLSSETGAPMPLFNNTAQYDLREAYQLYSAGYQQIVWHVWGAGYSYSSTAWPGHNATNFRQFGTRNPASANYDQLNAHLGRVQQFVQTGTSRTDVGFIHQNWAQGMRSRGGVGTDINGKNWQLAHEGVFYRSTEIQENGYTYDYFSPDFLSNDDVYFDEETKTVEAAGYKALVLYQDWLDIDGAKKIRDWAKKGLKVVILGNAASRTPFNDGKDAELASVIAELKTLDTVRVATVFDAPAAGYFTANPGGYHDNVLEKLQELGVQPYSGYSEPNHQLLSQTRQDDEGNRYVYLYNYDNGAGHQYSEKPEVRASDHGTEIATDIVQEGEYVPYAIDAFTGKVTELAGYRWEDGRTIVPIDLEWDNIELIAFEKVDDEPLTLASTSAASSYVSKNGIAVRSTQSGPVTTEITNGARFEQNVSVPAAYDVTNWNLTVQSWRPNATAADLVRTEQIDGLTTVNKKTSTVQTPISVTLPTLTTWDKIPQIGKKVSGTGHYTASFDWNSATASGAYLDLGDTIESSLDVYINGRLVGGEASKNPTKATKDVGGVGKSTIDDGRGNQVPLVGRQLHTGGFNWTDPTVDVSEYLVNGRNEIVIDYYSVLSNVQLDRGVITEGPSTYLTFDRKYRSFGPQQAKIVPFVDLEYRPESVSVAATPKALGGKAYLSVSVTNNAAVAADVVVTTPYGNKTFPAVGAGKTVSVSINTKLAAIPAGEVSVSSATTVNGQKVTATRTGAYAAFTAR